MVFLDFLVSAACTEKDSTAQSVIWAEFDSNYDLVSMKMESAPQDAFEQLQSFK